MSCFLNPSKEKTEAIRNTSRVVEPLCRLRGETSLHARRSVARDAHLIEARVTGNSPALRCRLSVVRTVSKGTCVRGPPPRTVW